MISLSSAQHGYTRLPLFLRAVMAINLSLVVVLVLWHTALGEEAPISREVPLLDDGSMLRVPVRIFNQTLYFVLDTGTSVSALDKSFRGKLGPPTSEIADSVSVALGKKLILYKCPDFSVGDTRGDLQRIACLDLSMFKRVSGERCDGILGMDFLGSHVISLDFDAFVIGIGDQVPETIKRKSTLVPLLTPEREKLGSHRRCPRPADPGKTDPDMSGLHLIREASQTSVYSIDAGSPAATVGIKVGDILLSMDGQSVAQMKMKDVRQRLKKKDGDKVPLEFMRGARTQRVTVTLKKLL